VKALLAWAFGLILSGCTWLPERFGPHHLTLRNLQPLSSSVVLDKATRIAAIGAVLGLVQRHHVDGIEPQRLAEWRSRLLLCSLAMPESEFWARLNKQLGEFEDSHTRLQSPDQVRLRGRARDSGSLFRVGSDPSGSAGAVVRSGPDDVWRRP